MVSEGLAVVNPSGRWIYQSGTTGKFLTGMNWGSSI